MTKQQPLVSVVIPCYNHAEFVQESIQSVIDQDYQNIELIIIDDGSKDNSVEVIQKMLPACEERFVRFEFSYRPNKGLCATLNEALEWCEGEFFSPLASDDIIKSYKISTQVEYLNSNPDVKGVFGDMEVIYKDGTKERLCKPAAKYSFEDIFLHKHNLPAPTQMLRLAKVKEISGYRSDLIIEDWSMWLFLTEDGTKLAYIDKVFSSYRRHEGNLSGDLDKMHKGRLQIVNLYKEHELYQQAKSRIMMIQAHEIQIFDKIKSIHFFIKAITLNPKWVFNRSFYTYFAKFIIKGKNKSMLV